MELLDYLGVACFEGPEAGDFLQAQLSADIGALQPAGATFACYCSPRGQVYGLLLVQRLEDRFLVIGSKLLLNSIIDRLRMFVFRTKVEFALDDSLRVYGLIPGSSDSLDGALRPAGLDLAYLVTSRSPEANNEEGFRALEIDHYITWLNQDSTEKYIPQMLGAEAIGAVSFSKGCYPGQEIVARAHYLGKVKRGPLILRAPKNPGVATGDRIELQQGDEWTRATVVDQAEDTAGTTHLFVIATAADAGPPTGFRFGDRLYRCATT